MTFFMCTRNLKLLLLGCFFSSLKLLLLFSSALWVIWVRHYDAINPSPPSHKRNFRLKLCCIVCAIYHCTSHTAWCFKLIYEFFLKGIYLINRRTFCYLYKTKTQEKKNCFIKCIDLKTWLNGYNAKRNS